MHSADKITDILEEIEDENEERAVNAKELAYFYKSRNFEKVILEKNVVTGNDKNLMIELEAMNAKFHTTLERNITGNKILAPLRKLSWKIRTKMFRPMFYEQNEINQHTVASLNELNRMRCEYELEISHLRDAISRFNTQNQLLSDKVNKLEEMMNYLDLPLDGGLTAIEYEKFENEFRGSEEVIKERLQVYLPYYRTTTAPVLEIGSGRGEFLEIMKENNIEAKGVDIFYPFVQKCNDKGLDVIYGNGVKYLAEAKDDSLGGIFAAQVIEHISNQDLILLCKHAYRTLQKGRFVILETPNPMCLSIYTNAFYIDPSHRRPIHPIYIEYIMKMIGFEEVHILYTEHSRVEDELPQIKGGNIENVEEINAAVKRLSDKLYGSQDYAVIAMK